jgi:DNA modification methylase
MNTQNRPLPSISCVNEMHGDNFAFYNGDSVELVAQLPPDSVDLMVYSPPFANLYTYSDHERDMGNVNDDAMFAESYGHLCRELFRVLRPGRMCVVHCADLPLFLYKDGEIGFKDFPGLCLRTHLDAGFVQYSPRVTIWKDPVTEMQRSKAMRLLYKNRLGDSSLSGVGNPDYLLVLKKPGKNLVPISHTADEAPLDQWQEWASPVWTTIDQTNTLNVQGSRDSKDGRHICPLQLDVIERVVKMWSNPGEIVLSPFGGIGSEGYGALTYGRKFVGIELKESYWLAGVKNLTAVDCPRQAGLFR